MPNHSRAINPTRIGCSMRETPEGERSRIMAMIRLRIVLEEEPGPDLHDALSGLAHDRTKGRIGWVVVNVVEVSVVEDILGFHAKLKIARSLCRKRELLQQCRIGIERPWISYAGKHKRGVAQRKGLRDHEGRRVQNGRRGTTNEFSFVRIGKRSRVV